MTSGYPRSGNTFLNQALNLIYYPDQVANLNNHSVSVITKKNKIIVPIRNPEDCIASWHNYSGQGTFLADIKFYLRLHNAVKNNLDKIVLINFDYFTKDLEYIKNKIKKNFDIDSVANPTINDIKNAMLETKREKHLPRNNKDLLDATKEELIKMPELQECIKLYEELKQYN